MNLTPEQEADIRSKVNPLYRDQRGTESHERATLLSEIDRLRAEVAELRHEQAVLRDPASLHANLLRGIPATLTKEQLLHLAGCTDYDALKNDSERLDWVERTIFECKWLGGLDSPSHWFIRGDYRHTTQVMRGETIRAAIDAALAKEQP